MYYFYEYPKCTTCKKAKAELQHLGIEFEAIDIKKNPPSADRLKKWIELSRLPLKNFFNTSGQSYRALGLKDHFSELTLDEAVTLLAADGMLIKRPILVKDDKVIQIGYKTSYEK